MADDYTGKFQISNVNYEFASLNHYYPNLFNIFVINRLLVKSLCMFASLLFPLKPSLKAVLLCEGY